MFDTILLPNESFDQEIELGTKILKHIESLYKYFINKMYRQYTYTNTMTDFNFYL